MIQIIVFIIITINAFFCLVAYMLILISENFVRTQIEKLEKEEEEEKKNTKLKDFGKNKRILEKELTFFNLIRAPSIDWILSTREDAEKKLSLFLEQVRRVCLSLQMELKNPSFPSQRIKFVN